LRNDAIGTASIAFVGLLLLGFGWRRRQALPIATGLVLFFGLGWRPIQLLTIDATPTSYYQSPDPFAVRSIAAGGKAYAQNCIACHGKNGQGDGPLAAELPIAPADLTAHLSMHTDGDLFWFISNGMDDGVMPPFSAALDEAQRWDLINFLKARVAGLDGAAMNAEVTADPAPLAPDFAVPAAEGAPDTLTALLAQDAVLLVFDDTSPSPLIAQSEEWRSLLAENGVVVVAIANDPELRATYALYDLPAATGVLPPGTPIEFLIDRDGYIRARWHPGDSPDWRDIATLTREITAMRRLKLAPLAQSIHVHPTH
jgi:mono/diheme cytochrome c family protein/peroxiredoxin